MEFLLFPVIITNNIKCSDSANRACLPCYVYAELFWGIMAIDSVINSMDIVSRGNLYSSPFYVSSG